MRIHVGAPARRMTGILGGMGPVASAEFLRTLYEGGTEGAEQGEPSVLMYSEPAFPDRTEAFRAGRDDTVLEPLVHALERMRAFGATELVLCCYTLHHLVPRLPAELRARVVSLLDLLMDEVADAPGRFLLLCSSGSREMRLYERHPRWPELRGRLVMPDAEDQAAVHHGILYQVKRNAPLEGLCRRVDALLERYGAEGLVAGCTEVHVLARHWVASGRRARCVDPLLRLAAQIRAGAPHAPAPRVFAGPEPRAADADARAEPALA